MTSVYTKNGYMLHRFPTMLPGGSRSFGGCNQGKYIGIPWVGGILVLKKNDCVCQCQGHSFFFPEIDHENCCSIEEFSLPTSIDSTGVSVVLRKA